MDADRVVARIRTIKPEMWSSHDFLALSPMGRLAFLAMIAHADDEGRMKGGSAWLARVMGGGVRPAVVEQQLTVMERRGMVRRWRSDDIDRRGSVIDCLSLSNWKTHQRIDHPTPSRIPSPPTVEPEFALTPYVEDSRDGDEGRIRETSRSFGQERKGKEGIGKDRKGPEGKGKEHSVALTSATANGDLLMTDPVQAVFQAWIVSTKRSDRTLLDDKRRRLIRKALAAYPIQDVLDAVAGWAFSAHHRGENDRNRPYNDLELILRDPKHIEQFRDFTRTPETRGRIHPLDREAQRLLHGNG